MDEQLCKELSELNASVATLKANLQAAFKRIDEQKALSDSVHELALSMKGMVHEQAELRKDVDEMKSRTARRWDTVVVEVIKLAIAVGAGAVLVKIGL